MKYPNHHYVLKQADIPNEHGVPIRHRIITNRTGSHFWYAQSHLENGRPYWTAAPTLHTTSKAKADVWIAELCQRMSTTVTI